MPYASYVALAQRINALTLGAGVKKTASITQFALTFARVAGSVRCSVAVGR